MHAVLDPAKGDAGQAPGDEACVDGVEAVKEAGEPRLGAGGRARVDVLRGRGQEGVGAVGPVLGIVVLERAVVVLHGRGGLHRRLLFLNGSGHRVSGLWIGA